MPGRGWVKTAGLVAGPPLAVAVYFGVRAGMGFAPGGSPGSLLMQGAPGCAAVATLMAVWWMTEALPLAATSLLPLALFPLLGVLPMREAAREYGDPIVFLFLGGFLIQQAMERWGLHTRIALLIMLCVGSRPGALIAGVMIACAFLSMWVSNAATAAMMLPIGISLCQALEREVGPRPHAQRGVRNFGICMMLGIAYASTIGGLGTPIGTAPNMLLVGAMERQGVTLEFWRWVAFALPLVVVLLAVTWALLVLVMYPARVPELPGGRALVRERWRALGRMSHGEVATLIVFAGAAALWIGRVELCRALGWMWPGEGGRAPEPMLTDPGVAIIAGLLLFCWPVSLRTGERVLNWQWASRVPYGVLLLFGGGLSLAAAISATKIDAALGGALGGLREVPPLVLVLIITTCVVFASEMISNTALVATFLPITIPAAEALGVHPLVLALPVTIGASTAFMLPAGTPPNAIVFSAGYLSIPHMAKPGFVLNLVSVLLVTVLVYFAGSALLGISMLPAGAPPSP